MANKSCNCTMSISMLGDGCPTCQPETWIGLLEQQIEDIKEDLKASEEALRHLKERANGES